MLTFALLCCLDKLRFNLGMGNKLTQPNDIHGHSNSVHCCLQVRKKMAVASLSALQKFRKKLKAKMHYYAKVISKHN